MNDIMNKTRISLRTTNPDAVKLTLSWEEVLVLDIGSSEKVFNRFRSPSSRSIENLVRAGLLQNESNDSMRVIAHENVPKIYKAVSAAISAADKRTPFLIKLIAGGIEYEITYK
jgi:hypothetical protein